MRATTASLRKGFFGRSLDELKRYAKIVLNSETIKGPSGPRPLHDFHTADSIDDCKVMSDTDLGGFSEAALDWVPPQASTGTGSGSGSDSDNGGPGHGLPAHARFHGRISTALPPNRPEVHRSGFAAWRTRDRPPSLFGRGLWDIDMYRYLALRLKSDGRSYFVNVQTESIEPTDLHQHRLFARTPGEWETVLIKWNDFVRTNHGFVIEPQAEMLRQKVRSIGIGLTDRVPGPFDLYIERIWATNDSDEAFDTKLVAPSIPTGEGQLKTKEGKSIRWS